MVVSYVYLFCVDFGELESFLDILYVFKKLRFFFILGKLEEVFFFFVVIFYFERICLFLCLSNVRGSFWVLVV